MRFLIQIASFLLLCAFFSCKTAPTQTSEKESTTEVEKTEMQMAALQLLSSITDEQRSEASFSFEVEERFNWHFTPKERKGLQFAKLDQAQREKLSALMRTILSEQGYNKAKDIMSLELVLRIVEDRPENDSYRDPENYYFSLFGDPSTTEVWGWRFEGHHLSLNFSSLGNELSATPSFYGSNPAIVPVGERKGHEALDKEQNLARAFVKSLDETQQKAARVMEEVPEEIISGVARKVEEMPLEGLAYADMDDGQKTAFLELLDVYLGNMVASYAEQQLTQIKEAGFDKLHFMWAGGMETGDAHYYRIHGPTILVEYDNIQTNANHIHTIWRDLKNDFGEDLLSKHYRESDHH
ncbi:MAG: DUF3500 domain-containing protein [Bacteroidia bacterium]|nr:DUF3500 domain-containing protein [Bacteroidia bacterium]